MEEVIKRKSYSEELKKEAVSLVLEQGYQAAKVVNTSEKNLQRWVKQLR